MPALGSLLRGVLKTAKPIIKAKKQPLELPREVPQKVIDDVAPAVDDIQPNAAKEAVPVIDDAVPAPKVEEPTSMELEALDLKDKPSVIKTTEDAVVEVRHMLSSGLEQFDAADTHMPNFDTVEDTDDVKAIMGFMAERNRGPIEAARGPAMKDKQVLALAKDLGVSGKVVSVALQRQMGETFDAPTVVAVRQFIQSSATRLRDLGTKIHAGEANAKEEVMFARQHMLHGEMMTSFMGSRAEAGRRFRAHGIKISNDDFQMDRLNEITEMMGGRNMKDVAKMYAKLDTTEAINKANKQMTQSKIRAVAEEVYINSILSGIKTFVVNTSGNAFFPIKGFIDTAVAARLGRFMSGEEHVVVGEASAEMFGYLSSVGDAWRMAAKAFKEGKSSDGFSKIEVNYPRAISSENLEAGGALMRMADFFNLTVPKTLPKFVDKATDVVGAAVRLPTERLMTPTDEFFKTMARRGHVARMAYREANNLPEGTSNDEIAEFMRNFIENPPESILQGADDYAIYQTFQDPLGEMGKKVQGLVSETPGLKFVIPFIKTPVNIFKRGIGESTPLGLFSARIRGQILGDGPERDLAIARMAVGSSLAAIYANHVVDGTITGAGPSDFKALAILRATGWKPYSGRVPNPLTGEITYHSYQRMEPMAYIMGAVADAVEMMQWYESPDSPHTDVEAEKMQEHLSLAIVAGIVENTMNKTFMSGAASAVEALNDPGRYFLPYVERWAGAMIPYSSLRRDLTKIQDPYMREAWTFTEKLKKSSGIAGWADDLPTKKDLYGELIPHPSGSILGIGSPFPESKLTSSPVKLEVARVMMATRTVPLTKPSKRMEGVALDVHEYDRLVTLSRIELEIDGNTFNEALADLIASDTYVDSEEDMKSHLIKITQKGFDQAARSTLLEENDALHERVNERIIVKTGRMYGSESADEVESSLFGGQ